MTRSTVSAAVILVLAVSSPMHGGTVYIDAGATGDGTGTDWANACTTITAGLATAASGDSVWVKSATYEEAITLVEGVSLYGGFPTEASPTFEDRDWQANATVIDASGFNTSVVSVSGLNSATVDGFIITRGRAGAGGGIRCLASSLTASDCTVVGNSAHVLSGDGLGGGIYAQGSSVLLRNCHITGNAAVGHYLIHIGRGGGLFLRDSSLDADRCGISGNSAGGGGGTHSETSFVSMSRCEIQGNVSDNFGGAFESENSSADLVNCLIAGNFAAQRYGALHCKGGTVGMRNCTVVRNTAERGGAMVLAASSVVTNCILWNPGEEMPAEGWGSSTVTYCCVQGGWPGEGNLDAWPEFEDPESGDYRLRNGSPCIDRGSLVEAPGEDIEGRPRPGADGLVDIGAYETPDEYLPGPAAHQPRILYVRTDAPADGDGSSWESAFSELGACLEVASTSDEVWVAEGRYEEGVHLEPQAALFGGFLGTEVSREARDWKLNHTIIDATGTGGAAVVGADISTLDGFVVMGGSRDGGVFCSRTSATIANCTIEANSGGGVYLRESSSTLTNCRIASNHSGAGAGVCVWSSTPAITKCTIVGNSASERGGGFRIGDSSPTVTNCLIALNRAGYTGGAVSLYRSSPTFINCTFADNGQDPTGGGFSDGGLSYPTLVNCILWNGGKQFDPYYDAVIVDIGYSCVRGGWPGEGNIDAYPMFADHGAGDYRLRNGSPCIDRGLLDDAPPEDMEGRPRPGSDGKVDMGSYESPGELEPGPAAHVPSIVYVRSDAAAGGTGSSWETAFSSITTGLRAASSLDEIWVASAEYREALSLQPGVALYGGFVGTETSREERNWAANETIINATGLGKSVVIGALDTTVDGFTITGGYAMFGGGIFCNECSVTVANCRITGNEVYYEPRPGKAGDLENLLINPIEGGEGGGVYCTYSTMRVENCILSKNVAAALGGALVCHECPMEVINCTIAGNSSWFGAGAAYQPFSFQTATLVNCISWGNQPDEIVGEFTVAWSDIQGGYPGEGNINADPLFVDPAAGDRRLTAGSPCIDAGSNEAAAGIPTDLDGNVRIWDGDDVPGAIVDMGAYEYDSIPPEEVTPSPTPTLTPTPTPTPMLGDMNADGRMDEVDLFLFSREWQRSQ